MMDIIEKIDAILLNETDAEAKELHCQRCRCDYVVWFCPNDLWNAVQREGEHFLCPTCFTVLAEDRGITPTGWLVRPESESDGDVATLASRVAELEAKLEKAVAALMHYQYSGSEARKMADEALAEIRAK